MPLFFGMKISMYALAILPMVWLMPNHYQPWSTAWQDGLALALVLFALSTSRLQSSIPTSWLALLGFLSTTVWAQYFFGLLSFQGDALVISAYLMGLASCILLGSALAQGDQHQINQNIKRTSILVVIACFVSIYCALVQLAAPSLSGWWIVDLPPGARVFANVAQPNQLSTILFFGFCSVCILLELGSIGAVGYTFGAGFLLFGMVLTGSRTAWVQIILWALMYLSLRRRIGLQLSVNRVVVTLILFFLVSSVWPNAAELLHLGGARDISEQLRGGRSRTALGFVGKSVA